MKLGVYERLMAMQASRRALLKGAAGAATALSTSSVLGGLTGAASAQGSLRAEILKIPGVGAGSPGDAEWQKVGELCLGGTKETVEEGEFAGVELTFMGLNNQNLHNFLFRGFLKPWEAYTGAKINWIDLAQADYNARLQQSIATGTVDFDIIEMGAPFEGDVLGKGLASEMPDWVKTLIDMEDYVGYLQAPVGTWDGKTYRISIDGDCHTFAYRTDYFGEGSVTGRDVPKTWQEINEISKELAGKTDPLTGLPAHGYLDPLKGWGGFGFYFLENRAAAYAKYPGNPAWLFDPETMTPYVNNPAWVQAIQDVMDLIAVEGAYPADQINADPGTTAFQQFLAGTGSMLMWWGDVGSNAAHVGHVGCRRCRRLRRQPGFRSRLQRRDRCMGGDHERGAQHGLYRLGRLRDGPCRQRLQEAEGGLVGCRASGRQGPVAVGLGLSVGLPAVPQLALQLRRVGRGRLRPRLHRGLSRLQRGQLQPPERGDRTAHSGHLPVLLGRRRRTRQGLCRPVRLGAGNRGRHRGGMGKDHRPDRPRQPDRVYKASLGM
jgi:ABC-type glycerol-3-phosphate transport system substrate-binding protein